jgi:O-antigen/teichoic acid export membrane protein
MLKAAALRIGSLKTIKSIVTYNLASVLPAVIGFLITPLLSYYLTPSDYSVIALISTYLLLVQPFVGFVASGLITVEYFNLKNKPKEFSSLFSSILFVPVIPVILLTIITWVYFKPLCALASLPANGPMVLPLYLIAFFVITNETLAAYLVIEKKHNSYAIVSIGRAIVEVTLTWILVVKKGMSWEGRIYALYISTLLMFILSMIIFYREKLISLKSIQKKYVYAGLVFGSPLIFHMLGKFAINQSDRIFLAKLATKEDLGIYNMAYMFGSLSLFYIAALNNYLTPYLFERLARKTEKDNREIIKAIKLSFLSIVGVSILVIAFSVFCYYFLISRQYFRGIFYVPWIALSYGFWGGYILFSAFFFYSQDTKFLGKLGIFNALVNMALNFIFIKLFGAFGAVLATLLSFSFVFVIVFFSSKRTFNVPWFAKNNS